MSTQIIKFNLEAKRIFMGFLEDQDKSVIEMVPNLDTFIAQIQKCKWQNLELTQQQIEALVLCIQQNIEVHKDYLFKIFAARMIEFYNEGNHDYDDVIAEAQNFKCLANLEVVLQILQDQVEVL